MSGSVYAITPVLGAGLNQTYPTALATPPANTTFLVFPDPATQFGMQPGKVVQGSDANRYILINSGAAAIANNGTVTVGPPDFTQGGTGSGITGTNTTGASVPARTLFWANRGP